MESTGKQITRFILTGPESTGKSVLSAALAEHFGKSFIPEYARDYVLKLNRPYTYNDVLQIAKKQVALMDEYTVTSEDFLFVDTYLIITKVWFLKVFGEYPEWIDIEINKTKNDIYLLCKPDIPWIPDGVRENGGEKRNMLFNDYMKELNQSGLMYEVIEGDWDIRLNNAIKIVNQLLIEKRKR